MIRSALLCLALSLSAPLTANAAILDDIQGTWRAVAVTDDQTVLSQSDIEELGLSVIGNDYIISLPDGTMVMRFSVDEATMPASISLSPAASPEPGKTYLGAIELRGDRLTVVYASEDVARPSTLAAGPGIRKTVWRRDSSPGMRFAKEITNTVGMKLRLVLPGTFVMGAAPHEPRRYYETQRRVTLSRPFYMGAYEVTVGQYRQFVQERRSGKTTVVGGISTANDGVNRFNSDASWENPGYPQDDMHPVVFVTWEDTVDFCDWLSVKEGKTYRLPTEAEWEYAARGGTQTAYWWGDDPNGGSGNANLAERSYVERFPGRDFKLAFDDGYIFTAPVGRFEPNPFGLYDMSGNVLEWVLDWWSPPPLDPQRDPQGPATGQFKLAKGGGWATHPADARSGFRFHDALSNRFAGMGFRVVLQID